MSRSLMERLLGVMLLLGLALPAAADEYTKTKYPTVLVHGLLGFDSLAGAADYWYGIPSELRAGGAKVHVANVSSVNSSEVRGEQVIEQLETLQALYGYTKFNLIGHSHGGQTVRYVAGVRPDLVVSATSFGTPHAGAKLADLLDNPLTRPLAAPAFEALGSLIELLSGDDDPQDAYAALGSLTTAGMSAFNASYPDGKPATSCGEGAGLVHGIRYYSFSGTGTATNVLDLSDALLWTTSLLYGFNANDGLVERCSSHWGDVIRDDYLWNHLDEVNQLFGLRSWFSSNPTTVYRNHLNRLKNAGL